MKKLTFLIALSFSVYSCKKVEVAPRETHNAITVVQTSELNAPWKAAANSYNPYDERGYHHNMLLNSLFADTPANPSTSDIYDLATDYVYDEFKEDITQIIS